MFELDSVFSCNKVKIIVYRCYDILKPELPGNGGKKRQMKFVGYGLDKIFFNSKFGSAILEALSVNDKGAQ